MTDTDNINLNYCLVSIGKSLEAISEQLNTQIEALTHLMDKMAKIEGQLNDR